MGEKSRIKDLGERGHDVHFDAEIQAALVSHRVPYALFSLLRKGQGQGDCNHKSRPEKRLTPHRYAEGEEGVERKREKTAPCCRNNEKTRGGKQLASRSEEALQNAGTCIC